MQENHANTKEQLKNLLKVALGTAGSIGFIAALGTTVIGIGLSNPLMISSILMTIPSVKATLYGLGRDYINEGIFGVFRGKTAKLKETEKKSKSKKVKADRIYQKITLKPLMDIRFISSNKKLNEEIKLQKEEFNKQKQQLSRDDIRKLKKELKENIRDIKKKYNSLKKKQVSAYYSIEMLNLFSQLKEKDKNGNKITYSFDSHGVTIKALKSMEKKDENDKGFVQNIGKYNERKKNMILEKIMFGNFHIKDLLKNKKTKIYDVTFQLTGDVLSEEDINKFVGKDNLECYDKVQTKNGKTIFKLNREKLTEQSARNLNTIVSSKVVVKNNIPTNCTLSREKHMSHKLQKKQEDKKGLERQKLKQALYNMKNNLLNAISHSMEKGNEIDNSVGKKL